MSIEHSTYETFLASKRLVDQPSGIDVPVGMLPEVLFDWQAVLVSWALKRGRAALFASTGLGKTVMQCAWASFIPGRVLIVAPLAVTHQTIREAQDKLSLDVRYVKTPGEMSDGISITNYDRIKDFYTVDIQGIVLDPFAGLGSTGVIALEHERQFISCELKRAYAEVAKRNLNQALSGKKQMALFA